MTRVGRLLLLLLLAAPALALAESAPADLLAHLDELMPRRDEPEVVAELDKAFTTAVATYPDDFEVLWRAARWKSWVADGQTHPTMLLGAGRQTRELGERAIAANPQRAEGYFFAALGTATWGQAAGMWKSLTNGVGGTYEKYMARTLELDATLNHGMPLVAMGKYHGALPWPLKDLKKSAEYYLKALVEHPENLRAHLWLAETLLADGDVTGAKEHLLKVAGGDGAYDPPEARRVKAWAAKLSESLGPK